MEGVESQYNPHVFYIIIIGFFKFIDHATPMDSEQHTKLGKKTKQQNTLN